MSLDLSLFTIEADLVSLIEMREEAQERIASVVEVEDWGDNPDIEATADLQSARAELETIESQIREYVTAEIRKVDGIRAYWKHAELMRDAAKAEAATQAERAKAWDDRLKRLKDTCLMVMETIPFPAGKPKKLEGRTGAIYLKGNGGKQAVEISDESLVPDEMCTVTVTFNALIWRETLKEEDRKWPNVILPALIGKRVPSLSLIGEELQKACGKCNGVGAPWNNSSSIPCVDCGGSGKRSVPGARLLDRGEHVEIK